MYRIEEENDREKYIMLIPAMLDAHFPFLKYAFYSKNYHPVILSEEEDITNIGLQYVNHDICYPAVLIVGQMVSALRSGKYDLMRTILLMPQGGDACRGSNYTGVLRRAVKNAGFDIPVLSLNVKGLEKSRQMKIEFGMVLRALFGVMYGDILMILKNQVEPYEAEKGSVANCVIKWHKIISEDLKRGHHLTIRAMERNFVRITEDFSGIKKTEEKKQKIGIVGELYVKYCHLGNWNLERFLRDEGCEYYVNGLSWYVLYYIDTHLKEEGPIAGKAYAIFHKFLGGIQKKMVETLRQYGFYSMDEFEVWKKKAEGFVCFDCTSADGWLIGAEAVNHIKNGYRKVIAVQPFDCMPNHVCGRGLYPSLQRKLKAGQIVSIDIDSGGSSLNVRNRIKLLLDMPLLKT